MPIEVFFACAMGPGVHVIVGHVKATYCTKKTSFHHVLAYRSYACGHFS